MDNRRGLDSLFVKGLVQGQTVGIHVGLGAGVFLDPAAGRIGRAGALQPLGPGWGRRGRGVRSCARAVVRLRGRVGGKAQREG